MPETSPALGRPRWAPDITVDAPLAARVIAEQFRELAGRPVVQIGVIDWGDTGLGDPAMDLAIGFMAFTGPARRAFLDAYGPADDERLLRARTLAVHLSAALAEQAVGDGMADVTAESLAALGRTAHGTPAVGSAPDVADR